MMSTTSSWADAANPLNMGSAGALSVYVGPAIGILVGKLLLTSFTEIPASATSGTSSNVHVRVRQPGPPPARHWSFVGADALKLARAGVTHHVLKSFESAVSAALAKEPSLVAPMVHVADDGAVLIEWHLPQRRIGISFERDPADSGWYLVDHRETPWRHDHGKLETLRAEEIVRLAVAR